MEAGSDIIQTNTFGASRIKLEEYGLGDKVEEINRAAVELAKSAAKEDTIVAASIGPTGKLLEPMGDLPFSAALEIFGEQAKILEEAGADAISIETMTDLQESRAALIGIKECTSLPVICHLTYEQNLKTMTGTDPLTAITVLEGIGADVIGANCSMGPEGLLKVIERMGEDTDAYLCVQPNAGLPILDENNNTLFPMELRRWLDMSTPLSRLGPTSSADAVVLPPSISLWSKIRLRESKQRRERGERRPT